MRYQKFIVVQDLQDNVELRIGYPMFHRDLLSKSDQLEHKKCIGGGLWTIDFDKKEIILYGHSDDFGEVEPELLEKAIKSYNLDDWMLEELVEDIYDEKCKLKDFKFITMQI